MAIFNMAYLKSSGGGGWQPGTNTLLYMPLNDTYTYTDQSGNSVTTTPTGNITYSTIGAELPANAYIHTAGISIGTSQLTINVWLKSVSASRDGIMFGCWTFGTGGPAKSLVVLDWYNSSSFTYKITQSGTEYTITPTYSLTTGTWFNAVLTVTSSSQILYVNGVQISSSSYSPTFSNSATYGWQIHDDSTGTYHPFNSMGISELILEDKVRTTQEIADYYNQTKANYGL